MGKGISQGKPTFRELIQFEKIGHPACKVCESGYRQFVEDAMSSSKFSKPAVVRYLRERFAAEISIGSIGRHMQNHYEQNQKAKS